MLHKSSAQDRFAASIAAFLRERLPVHRGASEHICLSYAYTFELLFHYVSEGYNVTPSALEFEQLDWQPSSPYMRFCEYREPAILEQSRCILAIPFKRTDVPLIDHRSVAEMQAILNAPDLQVREGLRDRTMLYRCFSAGLRVSELVGLPLAAVELQSLPSLPMRGKGRRERCPPLWKHMSAEFSTLPDIVRKGR